MYYGFHSVTSDILDFCKVISGSSLITILQPVGPGDLIVQYLNTLLMWSAWSVTFLVGLKTLSGKKTIGEAFSYFKNGVINLFKGKNNDRNNKSNQV